MWTFAWWSYLIRFAVTPRLYTWTYIRMSCGGFEKNKWFKQLDNTIKKVCSDWQAAASEASFLLKTTMQNRTYGKVLGRARLSSLFLNFWMKTLRNPQNEIMSWSAEWLLTTGLELHTAHGGYDLCCPWSWHWCPYKCFPLILRLTNGSAPWQNEIGLALSKVKFQVCYQCPFQNYHNL